MYPNSMKARILEDSDPIEAGSGARIRSIQARYCYKLRRAEEYVQQGLLHKAGFPPYDGTHALTTTLLVRDLDKSSLELAMN